jgi:hypothetical protein
MKFTVGMLDASPVFVKDAGSGSGSGSASGLKETRRKERASTKTNTSQLSSRSSTSTTANTIMLDNPNISSNTAINEVSPMASIVTTSSTDHYSGVYDQDMDSNTEYAQQGQDVDYVQDWSLNQLYHFENFQVAEDIFASQRFIEKYDESGNNFAGF